MEYKRDSADANEKVRYTKVAKYASATPGYKVEKDDKRTEDYRIDKTLYTILGFFNTYGLIRKVVDHDCYKLHPVDAWVKGIAGKPTNSAQWSDGMTS